MGEFRQIYCQTIMGWSKTLKKAFLRLLPDFVQEDPNRYIDKKFLYYILITAPYFLVGVYGYLEHNDTLFWLNMNGTAKAFLFFVTVPFFILGFFGFFIITGLLLNIPFQILKELWKILLR